ncbi:MAG: gephyrin-like molybdotransferase Glp [Methylibium sp.]|jgi:molybdopterin molybdotransferase
MLSVDEARTIMLEVAQPLPAETVKLADALGRVLAAPVIAPRDHPPFPSSAMDGYAVRSADTPGSLKVVGEAAAGHGFDGPCEAETAVRIATGGAAPEGADTIVIQEDVTRNGDRIDVPEAKPGKYIRKRGLDFPAGTELLPRARKLDGIALALAAASGAGTLSVVRRPRIAILNSGDELAEPGSTPGPFQIFESGNYGIAGLISAWGGVPLPLGLLPDDEEAIARAAERGLAESDLLVMVGGASVGDHDFARPALERLGLELKFSKVSVRPGKPTWFGTTPKGPVLGLPGNPASALVCAYLFLHPLMEAMLGRDPLASVAPRPARLAGALPANGKREQFLRARCDIDQDGQLTACAFGNQDSSLLSIFAAANALIRQAADTPALAEGALVDVLLLSSL